MRFLNVTAVLEVDISIGKGEAVNSTTAIFRQFDAPDFEEIEDYAVLSHCWGVEKEGEKEVSFKEMNKLLTIGEEMRNEIRRRTGYKKIVDTCRQAEKDDLKWVWVDTCCIDKRSSSELSEAINSMYQWYENAKLCYAYLHDTVGNSWTTRTPKWFSRGWTLQELVAPKVVRFFDQKWECIGDKKRLAAVLSGITRIPTPVLTEGLDSVRPSVARIISWAADRRTTREEDRAYSLLGLLGVHMPMLYGEGKNAFRRLQFEIMRTSNDQSIFAWGHSREHGWSGSFLADDPSCFGDCDQVHLLTPNMLKKTLWKDIPKHELSTPAKQWETFTVTNNGIEICLPTATCGSLSVVRLACQNSSMEIITIYLKHHDFTCFRVFSAPIPSSGEVEFKWHLFPYREVKYLSRFYM